MEIHIKPSNLDALQPMRACFLSALDDYVVYEAPLFSNATNHYILSIGSEPIGYVIYKTDYQIVLEAWSEPEYRELGSAVAADWLPRFGAKHIRSKTNDEFLCGLLLDFCQPIQIESLHFEHGQSPNLHNEGGQLRPADVDDLSALCKILCTSEARELEVNDEASVRESILGGDTYWALESDGEIVGVGAIWYNELQRRFVDVGMVVSPSRRQLGIGSFILQEIGKVCEIRGLVPRAGCFLDHEVSRLTLERAGFRLSSRMLMGEVSRERIDKRSASIEGKVSVKYD